MYNISQLSEKYVKVKTIVNGVPNNINVDINSNTNGCNIDIYINNLNSRVINMYTRYDSKRNYIHIVDIQSEEQNRGKGYGSMAMNLLFEIGTCLEVTSYTGALSDEDINDPKDPNHRSRLKHFYEKFGFDIDFERKRIEKNIL